MSLAKSYPTALLQPIDRTARAVVSSGASDDWTPPEHHQWWAICPPCSLPPEFENLRGTKKGRMSFVGYFGINRRGKTMLVVRCACGKFELRRKRVWLKSKSVDMCRFCSRTERLRYSANK